MAPTAARYSRFLFHGMLLSTLVTFAHVSHAFACTDDIDKKNTGEDAAAPSEWLKGAKEIGQTPEFPLHLFLQSTHPNLDLALVGDERCFIELQLEFDARVLLSLRDGDNSGKINIRPKGTSQSPVLPSATLANGDTEYNLPHGAYIIVAVAGSPAGSNGVANYRLAGTILKNMESVALPDTQGMEVAFQLNTDTQRAWLDFNIATRSRVSIGLRPKDDKSSDFISAASVKIRSSDGLSYDPDSITSDKESLTVGLLLRPGHYTLEADVRQNRWPVPPLPPNERERVYEAKLNVAEAPLDPRLAVLQGWFEDIGIGKYFEALVQAVIRGLKGFVIPGGNYWEKLEISFALLMPAKSGSSRLRVQADGLLATGIGGYPPDSQFTRPMEPEFKGALDEYAARAANEFAQSLPRRAPK